MPRSRKVVSTDQPSPGKRSERETVVTLRLPVALHERLKKAGGERGLTAQIRDRLDASLTVEEAWDDPVFTELTRATSYVVTVAALLYPNDPEAYSIVELAIRMILEAFRPVATKDLVREVYISTTYELMGKVERVLGAALGRMGDAGVAKAAKLPMLHIEPPGDKPRGKL
jgi:hypothetical protein